MTPTPQPPVLAIQVGNTRIKLAAFRGEDPDEVVFVAKDDLAGAVEAATRLYESIGAELDSSVVIASVNKPVSDALVGALRDQLSCDIYTVPDDMPAPIGTCLDAGARPGVDRLLNAAAAYGKLGQACIVIDAGTCEFPRHHGRHPFRIHGRAVPVARHLHAARLALVHRRGNAVQAA